MTVLWIPLKILLFIVLFIGLATVAAGFLYKAYQDKQAEDVADQPKEVKEHAKEGMDNPKEEEEVDDPAA